MMEESPTEARAVAEMPDVTRLIEKAAGDDAVLAVMLFGSRARGDETLDSDIDLCLVLRPGADASDDVVTARLEYLPSEKLDVRVFQQLPLYIRPRVLREGVILHCKDLDSLYEVAYRAVKAFERFKPYYRRYLEQVARAGS